jgi:Tfp pilus assembly protein PilP
VKGPALAGAVLILVGCTGSPSTAPAPAPAAAPALSGKPVEPAPAGALTQAPEIPRPPAPSYETKGRRDPFEILETREGAGGTSVSAAKLAGIVRSDEGPLALIETPDGLGYILRPGDTLGDGRLVEVLHNSVVFSVPTKHGGMTNRVVLKLPGDP